MAFRGAASRSDHPETVALPMSSAVSVKEASASAPLRRPAISHAIARRLRKKSFESQKARLDVYDSATRQFSYAPT